MVKDGIVSILNLFIIPLLSMYLDMKINRKSEINNRGFFLLKYAMYCVIIYINTKILMFVLSVFINISAELNSTHYSFVAFVLSIVVPLIINCINKTIILEVKTKNEEN